MAGYLKALTTVSRSTAAALSQNPAVVSPAAVCHHRLQQRNCKFTVDNIMTQNELLITLMWLHEMHSVAES